MNQMYGFDGEVKAKYPFDLTLKEFLYYYKFIVTKVLVHMVFIKTFTEKQWILCYIPYSLIWFICKEYTWLNVYKIMLVKKEILMETFQV